MENHPDQGGDMEKFKEIKAAYEVVSDEQKRAAYDQFGPAGVTDDGSGGQPGGGFGAEDIFSQFFGGGFGAQQRRPQKTENVSASVAMSLEELYSGATKELRFNKQSICHTCDGQCSTVRRRRPCGWQSRLLPLPCRPPHDATPFSTSHG